MLSQGVFYYEKISKYLDQFLVFLGVACLGIFVFYYGFPLDEHWSGILSYALYGVAITFVFQEVLRLLFCRSISHHVISRRIEFLFIILLSLSLFAEDLLYYFSPIPLHNYDLTNLAIGYLALTQAIIFFAQALKYLRKIEIFSRHELTASRLMVFSFMVPIAVGTLLLKLPNATVANFKLSWIDALFTATSAVCVTGLGVVDTANTFTALGKTIIASLIQVGGLGIMTLTMSFGFIFASGLAVKERLLFSELLAEDRLGRVGTLLAQITFFTFSVELIGSMGLYYSLSDPTTPFDFNLFLNCLFHAISAFCNAGFSLFSANLFDPLVRDNAGYSTVIMALVIVGGLGYPVFYNVMNHLGDRYTKARTQRTLIKTHARLSIFMMFLLLVVGGAAIFLTEGNLAFAKFSFFEKVRHSLFLSTVSRTAGYNIWPTEALSIETCVVLFFLMWVGGSPMSTAGGIKTLTLAVAWLNLVATIRGAKRVFIYGREIAEESIHKAHAIIFGSILIIGVSSLILIALEPGKSGLDLVFEVISAFSTVGLSRALTPSLTNEGKLLITLLMFVGRLGFLVVLNSFFKQYRPRTYEVLKERIPIS